MKKKKDETIKVRKCVINFIIGYFAAHDKEMAEYISEEIHKK